VTTTAPEEGAEVGATGTDVACTGAEVGGAAHAASAITTNSADINRNPNRFLNMTDTPDFLVVAKIQMTHLSLRGAQFAPKQHLHRTQVQVSFKWHMRDCFAHLP
jgi:hypothetical protein